MSNISKYHHLLAWSQMMTHNLWLIHYDLFFVKRIHYGSSLSSPFGFCQVASPQLVLLCGRLGFSGRFAQEGCAIIISSIMSHWSCPNCYNCLFLGLCMTITALKLIIENVTFYFRCTTGPFPVWSRNIYLQYQMHEWYFRGNKSDHRLLVKWEPKIRRLSNRNHRIRLHALYLFRKWFPRVDYFPEWQNFWIHRHMLVCVWYSRSREWLGGGTDRRFRYPFRNFYDIILT